MCSENLVSKWHCDGVWNTDNWQPENLNTGVWTSLIKGPFLYNQLLQPLRNEGTEPGEKESAELNLSPASLQELFTGIPPQLLTGWWPWW